MVRRRFAFNHQTGAHCTARRRKYTNREPHQITVGKNVTLVLYAAASIQLLSVILVAVFWCMGTGGGDEEWMDYDRKLGPTTTDHIEV